MRGNLRNAQHQAFRFASRQIVSVPGMRSLLRMFVRAGVVPRRVWAHLPPAEVVSFDVGGRTVRCMLPDTDGVARELDWIGVKGDEAATIEAIARLARRPGASVDVGANVGLYSVIAASCSDDPVFAFEPVPRTFDVLQQNLELNGMGDRVQTRRAAVGSEGGSARFHVPWGDCPSSASLGADGYRGLEGEVIDVDIVSLDEFLDPDDVVSFVKIDVEGQEHVVLDGMTGIIERWGPAIVLESNHDGPSEEVERRLRVHGYTFNQLRPEGPVPVTTIRTGRDERFRNFLCEPASAPG